jgi:hypothetical protein
VIIWINGAFGAGKTTLAEELHGRLPDAVLYDPEDVGLMLWKWMRPNGDFQHLPSWRELVVATALSLRRHHADTLIVPMSLIRDGYRAELPATGQRGRLFRDRQHHPRNGPSAARPPDELLARAAAREDRRLHCGRLPAGLITRPSC